MIDHAIRDGGLGSIGARRGRGGERRTAPLGQAIVKAVLLKHIERVGLVLGDEDRARIEGCNDPVLLGRWLDNAFTAKNSADVFREESAAK